MVILMPAKNTSVKSGTIPKTVVFCKGDVSLPPGGYLGMAQGLGEYNLIEVEGSHEAFFTSPSVVAGAFLQALE